MSAAENRERTIKPGGRPEGGKVKGGIAPDFPEISRQVDEHVPEGQRKGLTIRQKGGRPFWKR